MAPATTSHTVAASERPWQRPSPATSPAARTSTRNLTIRTVARTRPSPARPGLVDTTTPETVGPADWWRYIPAFLTYPPRLAVTQRRPVGTIESSSRMLPARAISRHVKVRDPTSQIIIDSLSIYTHPSPSTPAPPHLITSIHPSIPPAASRPARAQDWLGTMAAPAWRDLPRTPHCTCTCTAPPAIVGPDSPPANDTRRRGATTTTRRRRRNGVAACMST